MQIFEYYYTNIIRYDLINKFYEKKKIFKSIKTFGYGKSDKNFFTIINKKNFWKHKGTQKKFYEIKKI